MSYVKSKSNRSTVKSFPQSDIKWNLTLTFHKGSEGSKRGT